MRAVRGTDTTPELVVRRVVHGLGFRYALHSSSLPGKPDLVLVRRKKVIFVHGCFWHKHWCRHGRVAPSANSQYWNEKRQKNANRDRQNILELRKPRWNVLVIWECWTKDLTSLRGRLKQFLGE